MINSLVGIDVGSIVGDGEGDRVFRLGAEDGSSLVGAKDGSTVGGMDGDTVGGTVGAIVGAMSEASTVGESVRTATKGAALGFVLGILVGSVDGVELGTRVGLEVGSGDGGRRIVGRPVVGEAVGVPGSGVGLRVGPAEGVHVAVFSASDIFVFSTG